MTMCGDDGLRATDTVESYDNLCLTLCWDDGEDPAEALAGGTYAVCGGEWRREQDNQWRFWEDEVVMDELDRIGGEQASKEEG